jgi:hypothetical protein
MRQFSTILLLLACILQASAQTSGPDKVYQDALVTTARSPYLMPDGRLLFITEKNLNLFEGKASKGAFLKCLQGNQELWEYKLSEGAISDGDIVIRPDGSIYVGFMEHFNCNSSLSESFYTWIHLMPDGQLIKKLTLEESKIKSQPIENAFGMKLAPNQAKAYVLVQNPINREVDVRSIDLENNLEVKKIDNLPIYGLGDAPVSLTPDTFGLNTVWVASHLNIYKIQGDSLQAIIPGGVTDCNDYITFAPDGSTISIASSQTITTYAITPDGIGPQLAQIEVNSSNIIQLTTMQNGELCAVGTSGYQWGVPLYNECIRWPSAIELSDSTQQVTAIPGTRLAPQVIPTLDYILLVQTGKYGSSDIYYYPQYETTAEIRRHAWVTGAPLITYPDLKMRSVNMDPDTWGFIRRNETSTDFYINCPGGKAAIVNQNDYTINSLVLTALFGSKVFFNDCTEDLFMRRRFDNLNLPPYHSIDLPIDSFIIEGTYNFSSSGNLLEPIIFAWVVPDNIPDKNPDDNGLSAAYTVVERTPPGKLDVFPNPVSGDYLTATIEDNDLGRAHFRIYNMLGQLVSEQNVQNTNEYYTVPIGDIPKGIYYLRAGNDAKIFIRH